MSSIRRDQLASFNRWRREVYHSPERSFRWNGAGMAGTYYYLITYTNGRKFKGWLEVLPAAGKGPNSAL